MLQIKNINKNPKSIKDDRRTYTKSSKGKQNLTDNFTFLQEMNSKYKDTWRLTIKIKWMKVYNIN